MFRNKIRETRRQRGLTQTQLACAAGLAAATLCNIELGNLKPWPKARRGIATALDVREEELFSEESRQ